MNLAKLSEQFGTKEKCMNHLEKVRWGKNPTCPVCDGPKVYPRRSRKHYWHCNICNKDFTVLKGTIFEASKMPLQKWFLIISLMLDAKKGISSKQISRNLGITYKTAWFACMRIRCAMSDQGELLEGIVEMDETYVGGKPRYRNKNAGESATTISGLSFERSKRGRGTNKIPVVGIVQRRGNAVLKIMDKLSSKNLLSMLKKNVNMDKSELMTDEFRSYSKMDEYMTHHVIKHVEKEYARGRIHTNTIEGLWSIVKNGIRGQYHALSRKYLPFYLVEFTYKFNRRYYNPKVGNDFKELIENAVEDDKCLVNYKPNYAAKKIIQRHTTRKDPAPKPKHPRRGRPLGSKNKRKGRRR